MEEATLPEDNIILLRKWEDYGTRYGEPEEIFGELLEELDALYETLAKRNPGGEIEIVSYSNLGLLRVCISLKSIIHNTSPLMVF